MVIGAEGQPGLGAMGLADLAEAPRFRLTATRPVGGDVLHEWTRADYPFFFVENTQSDPSAARPGAMTPCR